MCWGAFMYYPLQSLTGATYHVTIPGQGTVTDCRSGGGVQMHPASAVNLPACVPKGVLSESGPVISMLSGVQMSTGPRTGTTGTEPEPEPEPETDGTEPEPEPEPEGEHGPEPEPETEPEPEPEAAQVSALDVQTTQ